MKVTFNYKMYRMACIFIWLLVIGGFGVAMAFPTGAENIGFAVGIVMVYGTLIFSGLGLLWEIREKFKKEDSDVK